MKDFRTKAVMLGVLCVCLAPVSQADEQTKETHMSINGPLQVRDILLPPGQYVFRLTEPDLDHSVVSIYNAQTNRLEGTIIGAPAYRLAADDKHLFTISQPQAGQPAKLQTWFYPGDNFGVEFPRQPKAMETVNAIKSNGQAPDTGSAGDSSSTR
jgi:hypothetical protein